MALFCTCARCDRRIKLHPTVTVLIGLGLLIAGIWFGYGLAVSAGLGYQTANIVIGLVLGLAGFVTIFVGMKDINKAIFVCPHCVTAIAAKQQTTLEAQEAVQEKA